MNSDKLVGNEHWGHAAKVDYNNSNQIENAIIQRARQW
jgi:hypothetical protein